MNWEIAIWFGIMAAFLVVEAACPLHLGSIWFSVGALVAMIAAALVGVVVANPEMNLNAFNGFTVNGQHMFPILFVTIACGAVSGFHALVSSGTASKQIKNEKDKTLALTDGIMNNPLVRTDTLAVFIQQRMKHHLFNHTKSLF